MNITIKNKLNISTYTDEDDLKINLEKGLYNVIVENENITIISEKEAFYPDAVTWHYVGEPEYASIGSDFPFVLIKDEDDLIPNIETEWIIDSVDNAYLLVNALVFSIPCGNGGGLFVYTTKNKKGQIIGVRLCGLYPEDI